MTRRRYPARPSPPWKAAREAADEAKWWCDELARLLHDVDGPDVEAMRRKARTLAHDSDQLARTIGRRAAEPATETP